jgi:hypothetical protein
MKTFALVALLSLAGCTTLGIAPPQTLDQKLAYAQGAIIAAQQSIAQATKTGLLTSAQAINANNMTISALSVISTARSLETSNATAAANDLALVTAAIAGIQQYLTSAGVK